MPNIEDEALVIELAATVEDRTRGEHAALLRRARRVDAVRNLLSLTNPRARTVRRCDFGGLPIGPTLTWQQWQLVDHLGRPPHHDHPKACACRGAGWVPAAGLSRLELLVAEGAP
jgi:hypothetical protein